MLDTECNITYNKSMETKQLPKPTQRIKLIAMYDDPHPVTSGSKGTVSHVQQVMGLVHINVAWDSGRTLSLIDGVDKYELLTAG